VDTSSIDFANLTLLQLVSTLLFFATVDTATTVALAIINGNFRPERALDYLRTHVLKVGTPILGLGVVGHGVPAFGIPAIPGAGLAASVSLVVYAVATIASLRSSFEDKGTVSD